MWISKNNVENNFFENSILKGNRISKNKNKAFVQN